MRAAILLLALLAAGCSDWQSAVGTGMRSWCAQQPNCTATDEDGQKKRW